VNETHGMGSVLISGFVQWAGLSVEEMMNGLFFYVEKIIAVDLMLIYGYLLK
jgi:hypothetical protein